MRVTIYDEQEYFLMLKEIDPVDCLIITTETAGPPFSQPELLMAGIKVMSTDKIKEFLKRSPDRMMSVAMSLIQRGKL